MSVSKAGHESNRTAGFGFLVVLAIVIASVFAGVYIVYLRVPSSPPTYELGFSAVVIDAGQNASWSVTSVSGGPYSYSRFSMRLAVNGASTDWVPLGQSDEVRSVIVASIMYHLVWHDADGNRSVSKGDVFFVTGENAPLLSLSTFEFRLKWMESWIATARWGTS
jgi:hypothetical protein